jgi:hypothetical protein
MVSRRERKKERKGLSLEQRKPIISYSREENELLTKGTSREIVVELLSEVKKKIDY